MIGIINWLAHSVETLQVVSFCLERTTQLEPIGVTRSLRRLRWTFSFAAHSFTDKTLCSHSVGMVYSHLTLYFGLNEQKLIVSLGLPTSTCKNRQTNHNHGGRTIGNVIQWSLIDSADSEPAALAFHELEMIGYPSSHELLIRMISDCKSTILLINDIFPCITCGTPSLWLIMGGLINSWVFFFCGFVINHAVGTSARSSYWNTWIITNCWGVEGPPFRHSFFLSVQEFKALNFLVSGSSSCMEIPTVPRFVCGLSWQSSLYRTS